ncbi:DUF72 domain-containing protein [Actinocatenispora rupis]|uniref:DUF72 domain-containing protein n=1 Tax=Actinocatenispora rupis TaxID=519421 RepID=A0A8J3NCA4_9ACTN|nr:DUF72 domain-containing protein [Actinocatenispora rupis]GID11675.1 hypothetical protein Aru02nite_25640 [Actinocatenispora rupis]
MGDILVGTASWTDKTLLASGWYPADADNAERRLEYYASRFPIVEVDATYYTPPAERTAELWADRSPAGFTFNVKAFSLLTGHPTRVNALYKDLRPETDKTYVYPKDLDPQTVEDCWDRFFSALDPLVRNGKLGALLFQYPPWFTIRRDNKQYLLECAHRCAPIPCLVELRHASWFDGDNADETLDFLTRHRIPYVAVDMPQGHRSSVPPVLRATAPLSAVRFHGHSEQWTSKDIHRKFGYDYSAEELAGWAPKIAELAGHAERTHVLMNNCYRDYATRNAAALADLLAAEGADTVAAQGHWP